MCCHRAVAPARDLGPAQPPRTRRARPESRWPLGDRSGGEHGTRTARTLAAAVVVVEAPGSRLAGVGGSGCASWHLQAAFEVGYHGVTGTGVGRSSGRTPNRAVAMRCLASRPAHRK